MPNKDPEKRKKTNEAWRQRNKDKVNEAARKRRSLVREETNRKAREYQQANKERIELRRIQKLYGLSPEEYSDLLLNQRSLCLICKQHRLRLAVDHCHRTGNVRGLLCNSCNMGLGHFKDDYTVLQEASLYLRRFHEGLE